MFILLGFKCKQKVEEKKLQLRSPFNIIVYREALDHHCVWVCDAGLMMSQRWTQNASFLAQDLTPI